MRIPEQVKRLGMLLAGVLAVVLLLRFVVLPESMFSATPHQAATIVREMGHPVRHAGMPACRECHADIHEAKHAGAHRNIRCESCHGAAAVHAADPGAFTPPTPQEREFCYACHAFDPSRPNGFPQIEPSEHNAGKKCVRCHDSHDPEPPFPTEECSTCHGTIVKTTAMSSHASLECSTCHEVPEQHWTEPRKALPTRPAQREFCGQCHAAGAEETGAPQVDLASHGDSYKCWDCHYPHSPRVKP